MRARISLDLERLALHLREALARAPGTPRAAARRAGRSSARAPARARSGAARSPRFAGNGFRWRRCRLDDRRARRRAPRSTADGDRAVGAAPADHQQLAAVRRRATSTGGMSCAMRATFSARSSHHALVVARRVGDVAACRPPSRGRRCGARGPACPGSPRAAPASRGRAGRAGSPPGRCGSATLRARRASSTSGMRQGSELFAR